MPTNTSQLKNTPPRAKQARKAQTSVSDAAARQRQLFESQIALDRMLKFIAIANGNALMNPDTPDEKEYLALTDRITDDIERAIKLALKMRMDIRHKKGD